MLFSVMLSRFLCMLICMEIMGVSGVGMVGCMFVLTSSVGLSSLAVVTGSMFVVLSRFLVMLGAFFAHCFRDVSCLII
jgi:hypothetical protein